MTPVAGLAESDRLLTPKEVARRLRICPETLKHWRQRGKIGSVELSRNVIRYPESEVQRMIEAGRRGSTRMDADKTTSQGETQ